MKVMIQKIQTAFAIQNVSGLFKLMKYLQAMMAGMCFEYVYRVESDVWYLPLGIGILITVSLIVDCFSNYHQSKVDIVLADVSNRRELLLGFQKNEYFGLYEQGVLEYKDAIEKYLA